jgi:hypothetical protein
MSAASVVAHQRRVSDSVASPEQNSCESPLTASERRRIQLATFEIQERMLERRMAMIRAERRALLADAQI